jgi:hypothetical protein
MTSRRRSRRRRRIPWPAALIGRRGCWLVVYLSLALLFAQVSHPALHPLEVINPSADWQHPCPLSHTAAALLIALPLLMAAGLWLDRLHDPRSWVSHICFVHCLAPRPPPAQLL